MTEAAAHIDFETRSTTDLKKSGVYRYAEDPNTLPWGFSWRIGQEGAMRRWLPTEEQDPGALLTHIAAGGRVIAHNAAFERTIWNNIVIGRLRPLWPRIEIAQQDCTMARAAAIDHPQGLDMLCNVLETPHKKDTAGHALMQKMMRPRRVDPDGTIVWWDETENVDRLMDYCDQDVRTETDVDDRIPRLTDSEQRVWQLDQKINERGVHIDMHAVRRAEELVELAKKRADAAMRGLTSRSVKKVSSVKQIVDWLNERGIECETLTKGDQDDLMYLADLASDPLARKVVELRKAMSKTSTAKYKAMTFCASLDNRIRGLLAYHGAGPGRWAGRLIQPQNLPRVNQEEEEDYKIEWLIELLHSSFTIREIYDCIDAVYGPLACLVLLSRALRAMLTAEYDAIYFGGDFSNIEGRVTAWFAGEQWKLDAFAAYDRNEGPDLYKVAYGRSFGVDPSTVGKGKKRQIGKVQELALGFQGSVDAFLGMADNYGLDPYELVAPVRAACDPAQWERTYALFPKATNKSGLQRNAWTALKIVVDNWRAAHPETCQLWWGMQDAAVEAVSNPGRVVAAANGKLQFYFDERCMWLVLPSGRTLCYPSAHIVTTLEVVDGKDGPWERTKYTVWFWGVDPDTKRWEKRAMYGGLLTENAVQATARDLMVDAMFRLEDAGYPIVLTVHDELLTEPKRIDVDMLGLSEKNFAELMSIKAPVYAGLPVSVAAWSGERYNK